MKTIFRAYRYRIYPTQEQKILMDKHFGCTRYVYNHFLNERIERYKADKTSTNYFEQAKELTELKKEEGTSFLNEVNTQSLQYTLRNVDESFKNFFKGYTKFPKFKSKRNKKSFTVPQHTKIKNNTLYINKFREGVKIKLHREITGKLKQATVTKTASGKYFVSILCEEEYQHISKTGKSVGLDLGIKDLIITSDGIKYANPKHTKRYEIKLAQAQRHLSRKRKGSNSFENQRRKTALIHEKISNSRADALHQISKQLVTDYDFIAIEDLNVKGMVKNRRLSKSISDVSWYNFTRMLEYKAYWNDKQVVKIDRYYPSSKTCNDCGWIRPKLSLKEREWSCESCGVIHDRDLNAAKNILKEGIKIVSLHPSSAGTVEYTNGDASKSLVTKRKSMKLETLYAEFTRAVL